MEEDWKPFEVRETEEGTTLYLHGTVESRVKVEADRVAKILEAIKRGWSVDIQYAIIDGGIGISDSELERDETGKPVIAGEIRITYSEINGRVSFNGAGFNRQASFAGAIFDGVASFERAIFNGKASFVWVIFNKFAFFERVCFNGEAPFARVSFNDGASFRGASFNGGQAYFREASFKRIAYFNGASFGKFAYFNGAGFNRQASFAGAIFDGGASFERVSFNGEASFGEAIFNKFACFERVSFNREASFVEASFDGVASFERASFNGEASFGEAIFNEKASFNGASFKDDPEIRRTGHDKLSSDSFASIALAYRKSMLYGASYFFEKAGHGYWDSGNFSQASEAFRDAKVEYEKEGKYDEAGVMYVWEKDSTRRQLRPQILSKSDRSAKSVTKYLWLNVWKVTCNYGEAPLWFIGWAAFIILFFALIYSPLLNWWPPESWESWALIEFKEYPYAEGNSFLTALYFSVVTFATLGFGDITPMSNFGKIVVIMEVLSGYVMFGILITLVARKMTRS